MKNELLIKRINIKNYIFKLKNKSLIKGINIKNYIFKLKNEDQVIVLGLSSFLLMVIFLFILSLIVGGEIWKSNGIWNLVVVICTSPVLFIIWRFRDNNITEQIKTQRKDISLKEFQKLSEWVSGIHLNDSLEEKNEHDETKHLYSYNKSDGAMGLQISSIYNLEPFYIGFYGDEFRKPALNLLLSTWLILQHKYIQKLINSKFPSKEYFTYLHKIRENGVSPLGVAITRVLLVDGGAHIKIFPEVFPNLCLAGMNFRLSGVNDEIATLFENKNCKGINLAGSNLERMKFNNCILDMAYLCGTRCYKAEFIGANLKEVKAYDSLFDVATFENAILAKADLTEARAMYANFKKVDFKRAKLKGTKLNHSNLSESDFRKAQLLGVKLISVSVTNSEFKEATVAKCEIINSNFEEASSLSKSLKKALVIYTK